MDGRDIAVWLFNAAVDVATDPVGTARDAAKDLGSLTTPRSGTGSASGTATGSSGSSYSSRPSTPYYGPNYSPSAAYNRTPVATVRPVPKPVPRRSGLAIPNLLGAASLGPGLQAIVPETPFPPAPVRRYPSFPELRRRSAARTRMRRRQAAPQQKWLAPARPGRPSVYESAQQSSIWVTPARAIAYQRAREAQEREDDGSSLGDRLLSGLRTASEIVPGGRAALAGAKLAHSIVTDPSAAGETALRAWEGPVKRVLGWTGAGDALIEGAEFIVRGAGHLEGRAADFTRAALDSRAGRLAGGVLRKFSVPGQVQGYSDLFRTFERHRRGEATNAELVKASLDASRAGPLFFVQDEIMDWLGIIDRPPRPKARGGLVRHGELSLVGERGPEIVQLPAGSNVIPAHRSREALERSAAGVPAGAAAGGRRELHVIQQLDGREIARSTIRNLDDDEQWGRR